MKFYRGLLCALLLCSPVLPAAAQSADLETVRLVAARLQDVAGTAEPRDVNAGEFAKLKKSAQILQFKRLQFYYKLLDRFRVDSRGQGLLNISLVQNGARKTVRTSFGLRRTRDIGDEPAKKQGSLDFGMLSAALWSDYRFQSLGEESVEGVPCFVLKMTLIEDPGYGHQLVWLDSKTFRMLRREKYTREGVLKVRYLYKEPERSPGGIWYSRRIELYSPQGRFVGALQLTDLRINQGLRDELFR